LHAARAQVENGANIARDAGVLAGLLRRRSVFRMAANIPCGSAHTDTQGSGIAEG